MLADNKWTGLLTCKVYQYLSCLSFNVGDLDKLFELDHKHWLLKLKETKDGVAQKKKELDTLLSSQEM